MLKKPDKNGKPSKPLPGKPKKKPGHANKGRKRPIGAGKKEHVPKKAYQKLVLRMSRAGLTTEEMCLMLGELEGNKNMSKTTLYKHYKTEIDLGKLKAIVKVSEQAHKMAESGKDSTMTKYVLDRRGGDAWSPKKGDDDLPNEIPVRISFDISGPAKVGGND